MKVKDVVKEKFKERFESEPKFLARAPGRVNLIGEHTDYNLGFSLPMAIDRAVWIAGRSRDDRRVVLHSLEYPEPADFHLDEIPQGEGWEEYVYGMAWALQESGVRLSGWEGVLSSDIPVASGLSSSAALEIAIARAFWGVSRWEWVGVEMARIAKKHENERLGLKSGLLDQVISANGEKGKALLFDFLDLSSELVPMPEGITIVVMDTKVPRELVDSKYNERVFECQQAADFFDVDNLRLLTADVFQAREGALDPVLRRRARHVLTENERTLKAAEAMRQGDAVGMGKLMNASHVSLRDDYEVSCRELDLMVALSLEQPGCFGARMTGGGFGGCAIAAVNSGQAVRIAQTVYEGYAEKTGWQPEVYLCQAEDGASLLEGSQI